MESARVSAPLPVTRKETLIRRQNMTEAGFILAPPSSAGFFLDPTAMAEQQQFYLLLGNLMSPDNIIRKQSEVGAVLSNPPFGLEG